MMVVVPLGKLTKIFPYSFLIGMKNMRTIVMNEDTVCIHAVIAVPAYVRTPVDNQNLFILFGCQLVCQDAAGKTRTDDDKIIHLYTSK